MRGTYTPEPMDISGVELDPAVEAQLERLAANVHDVWAQRRLDEGWRYGPRRDERTMTRPDLVPYDELPDREKDYDRAVAATTLKAIVALGFRIETP